MNQTPNKSASKDINRLTTYTCIYIYTYLHRYAYTGVCVFMSISTYKYTGEYMNKRVYVCIYIC